VSVCVCATASALAALLQSLPAAANGRYPASNALLFSPSDSNLVVLRATFGILLSHDGGATWTWLCEDALGLPAAASEDPALGVTAYDSIVAGIYGGLEVSPDTGCTWAFAAGGLAHQNVVDVTVRRDAPHTVLALTSTYAPDAGADGSAGYLSQVYQSNDDGTNWLPLGVPIDPGVAVTSIEVAPAPGGGALLYVVGFHVAAPGVPRFFFAVDGAAWTERPMPPLSHEVSMYVAGVDPADASRVYLRSEGAPTAGQSRLFVTTDQGQSFQAPLALGGQMLGFALSADGSKIYAGSAQDGLYVALRANLDAGSPFQKTSSIHVQCLATHGTDLWACSDEASGFVAGVSADDGSSFAAKLHINGIQSAIACAPDATASQCSGAPFQQLCATLKGCATSDAGGAPDAGGAADATSEAGEGGSRDEGGPPIEGGPPAGGDAPGGEAPSYEGGAVPPVSRSSCGCSVAGSGGALGFAAFGGAALLLRRRRGR
jgi:MYXO-CTERM domain-containing protein